MSGPRLKVIRADKHIDEIDRTINRTIDRWKRDTAKNRRRSIAGRKVKQIPELTFKPELATVIGDAIHNLRVSLDHAFCVLLERHGATKFDNAVFPFSKVKTEVKNRIKSAFKVSGASPADEDFYSFIVNVVQPYIGGQHGLYELHQLDITDKHRTLLPTLSVLRIGDGDSVTAVRHSDGQQVVFERWDIREGDVEMASPLGLDPIEGYAVTDFNGVLEQNFTARFGNGELQHLEVVGTLRSLSTTVKYTVDELERRFC